MIAVKRTNRRSLASTLSKALTSAQLTRLIGRLERGEKVCCGKRSEWFIHPDGHRAIEVLATAPDMTAVARSNPREIDDEWMRTYIGLCKASGRTGKKRTDSPSDHLWCYARDLVRLNQGEILWAAKTAKALKKK